MVSGVWLDADGLVRWLSPEVCENRSAPSSPLEEWRARLYSISMKLRFTSSSKGHSISNPPIPPVLAVRLQHEGTNARFRLSLLVHRILQFVHLDRTRVVIIVVPKHPTISSRMAVVSSTEPVHERLVPATRFRCEVCVKPVSAQVTSCDFP